MLESLGRSSTTFAPCRRTIERPSLLIRTAGPPEGLVDAIRDVVWAIDATQPIEHIAMLNTILDDSDATSRQRLNVRVLGVLAVAGIVLAVMGLYGLVAEFVVRRHREFGVRMALGAERRDILQLVLGRGVVLAALGVLFGVPGALALNGVLSGILFQVGRTDLLTFAVAPVVMIVTTIVASLVPASAATRVEPSVALQAQ